MSVYDEWSAKEVLEALQEVDQDPSITVETEWELDFLEDMLRKLTFTHVLLSDRQREKCLEVIAKYHGEQYE